MPVAPKIKAFIEKLQRLPENKKKIILWVVMVVLGVAFIGIWMNVSLKRFSAINQDKALEPFNSLMNQTKLPDESLDKINEIKSDLSNNLEILNQLEEKAKEEQNSNVTK